MIDHTGVQKLHLKIKNRSAKLKRMMTVKKPPANERRVARLRAIVAEVLVEVLERGFHGTAAVELTVQDGTIQRICRKVERVEK